MRAVLLWTWHPAEIMEKIIYHKLLSFLEVTVLFGIPFAIFLSLLYKDPLKGCLLGFFAGLLFGFGILIVAMTQEKKAREIYNSISEREEVIYYTVANMFIKKGVSVGGRLYLTKQSIRFKELDMFNGKNDAYIPFACIEDVVPGDKLNCIEVLTRNGASTMFVVHEREKVRELFLQEAEAAKEKIQGRKEGCPATDGAGDTKTEETCGHY